MKLTEDLLPYVDKLTHPREKDVIKLLYGLDDGRVRKVCEVAQLFNVTSSKIGRIRDKAIRRLMFQAREKHSLFDEYKKIGGIMANEEILLNDQDLADMFKVAKNTVKSWKQRGQIPEQVIFKLPNTKKGTVRYIKSKVEAWINGCLQT